MEKRIIIAVAAALILLIGYFGYSFLTGHKNGTSGSGTIEAVEVQISSKVAGKLLEVPVEQGIKVKTGDILAQIEKTEYEYQLKAANAQYEMALDSFNRAADLYKNNFVSDSQYKTAKLGLEAAESRLKLAEIQLKDTTITSPLDGVVLTKSVEPGELVMPGSPIATVANLDKVELVVYIPEEQVGRVQLRQEVDISVDSYPNEVFKGKVVYISQKAEFTPKNIQTKEDRITQVFGIKMNIANLDNKLKPGMPADAKILWTTR